MASLSDEELTALILSNDAEAFDGLLQYRQQVGQRETKGDRVTISATAQVGNILAQGLQGSSYFRLKVFLTVPDLSPGNSDEVVLKALELQKFNKADPFKSFGVRDTIPGADSKAPFKTCDDKPLKK